MLHLILISAENIIKFYWILDKHHIMKCGVEYVAPYVLNLGNSWRRMANFTARERVKSIHQTRD
jgi:hypothetical protein